MKERPILFTPENAQKVHLGTKTQTRRIMKLQPFWLFTGRQKCNGETTRVDSHSILYADNEKSVTSSAVLSGEGRTIRCPYGIPGDHLWVRESYGFVWPDDCDNGIIYDEEHQEYGRPITPQECKVEYKALADGDDGPGGWPKGEGGPRWYPSIHMPRWACRTILELTAVRVERLQEIDDRGAIAEGCTVPYGDNDGAYRERFKLLWESIHGHGSWALNPWVWVLEFNRVQKSHADS